LRGGLVGGFGTWVGNGPTRVLQHDVDTLERRFGRALSVPRVAEGFLGEGVSRGGLLVRPFWWVRVFVD
jgi:hypothetical protein